MTSLVKNKKNEAVLRNTCANGIQVQNVEVIFHSLDTLNYKNQL